MRVPIVLPAAVFCLGLAFPLTGWATNNPLKALIEQSEPGSADSERKQFEAAVAAKPADTAAWLQLAELSFARDQPPVTLSVLEKGLATAAEPWRLWRFIAEVHFWDVRSGPKRLSRPGMSGGRKPPSELDEASFRRRAFEQALVALNHVCELNPDNPEARERQVDALCGLERWADAEQALRDLLEKHWEYPLAAQRAYCLHKLGRNDQAIQYLDQQLPGSPHCPDLYMVRAEVEAAMGKEAEAADSRSRGQFYSRLLPESSLDYAPDLAVNLSRLFGRKEGTSGMFSGDRLNEEISGTIDGLIARHDEAGAELLAALAWSHYAHGKLEDRAFAYLGEQKDVARLDRIFRYAQSPCTLRGCLTQLVAMKVPGTFERLCELLPRDGGFFPIGVVDLISELRDPRSAKPLIEYTRSKDAQLFSEALVALGRFDSPETRAHLGQWLTDRDAKPFAATGLHQIEPSRKHWKVISDALEHGQTFEVGPIAEYVHTLVTPEAKKLFADFQARVAKERAKREREQEGRRVSKAKAAKAEKPQ
jgi:tetratricopeptide (TPR) repeat protein